MVVNVPSRQIYLLRQQGDVFRVDSTNNLLKHHSRIAVKLEDTIELLRKRDFVHVQSPGKTAHSTETLAFGWKRFTALECVLRAPAFGDFLSQHFVGCSKFCSPLRDALIEFVGNALLFGQQSCLL